ncbi:hypothetical protein A5658_03585 [Mycobacterium sp. 1245111.1]|uniref:hypothetical protein n=1 Tax=Mycobacterium sp. 1245111.1 TaxID=1834073 RepID=UPI0007FC07EF|nr:hypothetical protein [Mycobacterium sp. 1245111.1]OBK38613.1 hypothetical protein A5658_03585 [Mycobacterium sp. 1245111.1]
MAPRPAEDGAAGDAAELQRLQHEIRAAIKERSDIEQRLANPDALRAATARAHRDRDAVTNPLLDEARGKVSADIAALNEAWRHVDTVTRSIDRLNDLIEHAPAHIRRHRDAIAESLPNVRQARAKIAERLRAAGLESLLPEEAGDGAR